MPDELTTQTIDLPSGALHVLQPADAAELPDDGPVEWAPVAPYWAVLWRSGVTLAREVDAASLEGLSVVELGCGLGLPSLTAARGGARALATDADPEALELVARNAEANGLEVDTALVDWAEPWALLERGLFDLVLAADVLYERPAVAQLMALLPELGPECWLADPGRPAAEAFLAQARERWRVETKRLGVVAIHRTLMPPLPLP